MEWDEKLTKNRIVSEIWKFQSRVKTQSIIHLYIINHGQNEHNNDDGNNSSKFHEYLFPFLKDGTLNYIALYSSDTLIEWIIKYGQISIPIPNDYTLLKFPLHTKYTSIYICIYINGY